MKTYIKSTVGALTALAVLLPLQKGRIPMKTYIKSTLGALTALAVLLPLQTAPSHASTKVEFWFPVAVQGKIAQRVQGKISEFNNTQTDVEVVPSFTGNYDENAIKAQAAFEAGRPPDVVLLSPYNIFDFWLAGYIESIDDYLRDRALDPDEFYSDFWESNFDNVTFEGTHYAIPYQNSIPLAVYNCDHMEAAGLDCNKLPETWAELLDVAKKLTKREGDKVTRWGVMMPTQYDWFGWGFHGWVLSNGGDFYNTGFRGEVYYDNPTTRGALQFWHDLAFKHRVMPQGVLSGKGTTTAWFAGKTSIMAGISTGSLTFLRENSKFKYGVGFIPWNVRNLTTIGGAAMTIMRKDRSPEQREAIWKFLSWMTNAENLADWSRKSGYFAPRKSAYELPVMKEFGAKHPETLKVLGQLKCCTFAQFQVYKGIAVRKAIEDEAQAVMSGKKSVDEALVAAQQKADEIMKPYIDATVMPPK
jgi:sn-glycerol 3-phosphate transport system substrate-binding protein